MRRWLTVGAATATLVLALAACGEEADDVGETPAGEDPAAEAPADGDADVAVASTDLGDVLVDGEGRTLYLFDNDEQGESTCVDDCAENWPPLTVDGEPVAGTGADDALLGTTERDDGSTQLTYDGWPLYHWAGDEAAGDTNGQAVGDVWWVVGPDGTPIRDAQEEANAGLGY